MKKVLFTLAMIAMLGCGVSCNNNKVETNDSIDDTVLVDSIVTDSTAIIDTIVIDSICD